jgi:hypothetical protein
MSTRELLRRFIEQIELRALQTQHFFGRGIASDVSHRADRFSFCTATHRQLPDLDWKFEPEKAELEALLAGEWPALGFDWTWRPATDVWHESPDTGRAWPRRFFGSVPYRPGNPYGDARVVWEPSRLQQLIAFALIARTAQPEISARAVALLEDQLLSWIEANPPLTGVHYVSSMECALRLLSVCYALDMVRDKLQRPVLVWNGFLKLVASHASVIVTRLSLHSSAGNHTIAECVGLIYAGILFPEFKRSQHWKNSALALLQKEIDRQVLPDGGGAEQAIWYLLFATDLCGLVIMLLRHHDQHIPPTLISAVSRAKKFLCSFSGSPDELPVIGDSDNGYALSRFLRTSWDQNPAASVSTTFGDSGYTLIHDPVPTAGVAVIFDHGPLGMPPLYGHGHADALSLVLRVGKSDLLIDPGTYTYGGDPRWRRYFRSTRSHNTVCIDGADQACQTAAFMWSAPYGCRLVEREARSDGGVRLLARLDGYQALGGFTHWRGLAYSSNGSLLVWDRIEGQGAHETELNWHTAVPVVDQGGSYLLRGPEVDLILSIAGTGPHERRGPDTSVVESWYSPCYGQIRPARTIRTRMYGRLPLEYTTSIHLDSMSSHYPDADRDIDRFKQWLT